MNTPERFRAELKGALLAHAEGFTSEPLMPPLARPRRRVLVRLVPVTTALTAAASAAIILLPGGGAPAPASAATALYASAAALEHSGRSLELGPHAFLYQRTLEQSRFIDPGGVVLVRSVDESWMARNGSGRLQQTVLNPGALAHLHLRLGAGAVRLRANPRPFTLTSGLALSYAQLQRLPRTAKPLAAAVNRLADAAERRLGRGAAAAHPLITLAILRSIAISPAPTAVRASTYRVLAATPGIRLLGTRRDSLGRRGDLFVAATGPQMSEMLINPNTGRLLQFTRVVTRRSAALPGWRPGMLSRDTYVYEGVVASATSRVH